jgi:2-oxoglutarate dehydrogenase E1 component
MKVDDSLLSGQNLAFIEGLYAQYLENPSSLEEPWVQYFQSLPPGTSPSDISAPHLKPAGLFRAGASKGNGNAVENTLLLKAHRLIEAYRHFGHKQAKIDPLDLSFHNKFNGPFPELAIETYGLNQQDLKQSLDLKELKFTHAFPNQASATLQDIIQKLKEIYCQHLAIESAHLIHPEMIAWAQAKLEAPAQALSKAQWKRFLEKLIEAEGFEQFVHKKFINAKRFSLEGGESLIALLDIALEIAGNTGVEDVVFAMAHRGRLNVLANIMQKSPSLIFREFMDIDPDRFKLGGDVKYHLGYSSKYTTQNQKQLSLSLCFNPSHLEFVSAVLLGRVRAKQDLKQDQARSKVLGISIHGDSAFSGQGIVQESLNLSQIDGYKVGGTLHLIVNNQVGFTTPPESARIGIYTTEVAKMLQAPILHVNAEDPTAILKAVSFALEYRQKFQQDIVIDLYCYRKYGHNEVDEPAFTQPLMYEKIRSLQSYKDRLSQTLIAEQKLSETEIEAMNQANRDFLNQNHQLAQQKDFQYKVDQNPGIWSEFLAKDDSCPEPLTSLAIDQLQSLLLAQTQIPQGFNVHKTLLKLIEKRASMAKGEALLDWGAGEALAFASLVSQKIPVRITGQDSGRGTFTHRQSVWHDVQNGKSYTPINHISKEQAQFEVVDSSLSEAAVLGYEYGYSLDHPNALVIWEAQFGDFVNGAQVLIDQFISSSEVKWNRLTGITMLLPHGFEGQGPEHSSARLERFLALCAQENMQVCNLTTPAQIYHALRRQVLRKVRKPLIIMSPKSLLRHADAVSPLSDFSEGAFQRVIADPLFAKNPSQAKKIVLCSGKVYYDLIKARKDAAVAIHRIEQLYPLRQADLDQLLSGYDRNLPVHWVQEEPMNQGAWPYFCLNFGGQISGRSLKVIARPQSASPATGSHHIHEHEQDHLVEEALHI